MKIIITISITLIGIIAIMMINHCFISKTNNNSLQTDIDLMNGGPLDDSWWHVTDYYNNILNKVLNDDYGGYCANIMNRTNLPTRLCTTTLHSRTYHTPR